MRPSASAAKRLADGSALDRLELADNTIVCYSSDHGDHLSSHGYGKPADRWMHHSMRASKATPYEESAHIPFLIRWPGAINPGSRSAAFFGAIDFVPSLLGACGVPLPDGLQGRDISSLWRGEPALDATDLAPGADDSVFLRNMGNGWPGRLAWVGRWWGVRTERYTYARWFDHERGPWLFDRQEDPLETRNVVTPDRSAPWSRRWKPACIDGWRLPAILLNTADAGPGGLLTSGNAGPTPFAGRIGAPRDARLEFVAVVVKETRSGSARDRRVTVGDALVASRVGRSHAAPAPGAATELP